MNPTSQHTPSQRPFPRREILLFGGLALVVLAVFASMGPAYATRMMVEAACYAILALGLTIQWGYAGQFNAGIMGFVALGGGSPMDATKGAAARDHGRAHRGRRPADLRRHHACV